MIESIILHNFQSHKDTRFDFHPGINAIVGETDQGKSVLIRAYDWISTNHTPRGNPYVSDWIETKSGGIKKGKETSVTLIKDGKELKRYRNEKNGYTVEGKVLEAIGTDVPPEVSDFLNTGSVNLQKQLDSAFLVSYTSGEVSRFFNKLINLETIDMALSSIDSKKRSTTSDLKVANKDIEALTSQLEEYSWVDAADRQLKELEALERRKIRQETEYNKLSRVLDEIDRLERRIEKTKTIADKGPRLDTLLSIRDTYMDESSKAHRLREVLLSVESCEETLKKASKVSKAEDRLVELTHSVLWYKDLKERREILVSRIANCELYDGVIEKLEFARSERLEKLVDKLESLVSEYEIEKKLIESGVRIYNKVEKLNTIIGFNTKEIVKLEAQLPDTCPLCGGDMG